MQWMFFTSTVYSFIHHRFTRVHNVGNTSNKKYPLTAFQKTITLWWPTVNLTRKKPARITKKKNTLTYLGRSQPWGCHRNRRYSLSGRPCSWQVNCGCIYGHSDSSYNGRVNSSLTHLPLNKSQSSVFSAFETVFDWVNTSLGVERSTVFGWSLRCGRKMKRKSWVLRMRAEKRMKAKKVKR
jgi:hypothetical protein